MAVVPYWRSRLRDRQPLFLEALRIESYNVRSWPGRPGDPWPRAVAKQALLADYRAWFEQVHLPPFAESGYYQDCPGQLPKPASDLDFFVTMSPFLHVVGRAQQTRAHKVEEQRQHEGRWYTIKVHRNFVRLCEWDEHVATFELVTGQPLHFPAVNATRDLANMYAVVAGAKVTIKKLADNRSAMAIGKTKK